MRRRTFLKSLFVAAAMPLPGFRLPFARAAEYEGRFFVFVQADGGWDPTSFCDPKVNQSGHVINHWAGDMSEDDLPRAGNIRYALWANNKDFFDKHFDKMLVINGVDAQTNSHTTGVVHNWSGRISEGYPTATALLASQYGPELPVAYLNHGGYSETGGVARYTRLNNVDLLRNIAAPAVTDDPEWRYASEADWAALRSRQREEAARLVAVPNLLPADDRNHDLYLSALSASEELTAYAAAIPPEGELERRVESGVLASGNRLSSDLRRQAQLTVLAFKTGAAVSADLYQGGFDTHADHDPDHEWLLGQLTDGVDYLWREARVQGIDDRLVVVMGSDFGRTNKYNSQEGKDHWPYGSFIVMEKNQSWTDNVIGETDELHEAYDIDPATLERAGANNSRGTHIYPKHVHKALRKYLGIDDSLGARQFPFDDTVEDFAFFGPTHAAATRTSRQ